MTFKDLKKRFTFETTLQKSKFVERLHNKPSWVWIIAEHKEEDIKTDGDCCFNHIIGLPQKDGTDKPLYDCEKIIFGSLVSSPCLFPYDTQNGNANPNPNPNLNYSNKLP